MGFFLVFVLFICTCKNSWVNNRDAGDLRRHLAHYDVTVMVDDPWWTTSEDIQAVETVVYICRCIYVGVLGC